MVTETIGEKFVELWYVPFKVYLSYTLNVVKMFVHKKSKYILYPISARDGLVYYASFTEEGLKKVDLMSIFIVYIIHT